jgi:Xaa-Pro aminopeptidase
MDAFRRASLVTDHPPIVGFQANAANPHYEPRAVLIAPAAGDVLLLDLWAGVQLFGVCDQTWMAYAGRMPGAEERKIWEIVRGARDAAVTLLKDRWAKQQAVTGAALDDAARGVIRKAGYGEYFVHRTGHSIDRDLHGSDRLDNFETADERTLIPGVGFSVEPGIYLPDASNAHRDQRLLGDSGPEVTPSRPQQDLLLV